MIFETRIPTLLALLILVAGVAGGVYLISQNQILISRASPQEKATEIKVVNLSPTSASVSWQTQNPSAGFVKAGLNPASLSLIQNDDRDPEGPQKHSLHLATLNNLTPNTTYYLQVTSGSNSYPATPFEFKTPAQIEPTKNYSPITGGVYNSDLTPVNEALVTLKIPNVQEIQAITKLSGNFILTLSDLRTMDLAQSFDIVSPLEAKVEVKGQRGSSEVSLLLPLKDNNLPPIILGQNQDLREYSPSPTPVFDLNKFDLNKNGFLDILDRQIISANQNKLNPDLKADLNNDGKVTQADLDLFDSIPKENLRLKSPTPTPR